MAEKDEKPAEEEKKKGKGDQPDAAAQEIMDDDGSKDGEGKDLAENAIRGFIRHCLENFSNGIWDAADAFRARMHSDEAYATVFNQRGYFEFIGTRFLEELYKSSPGPLMRAMVGDVSLHLNNAAKNGATLDTFITNGLISGTAWASWYVRDSADFIIGDKWKDLVHLAAGGSNQFIPALHHLGLPMLHFNVKEFTKKLEKHGEAYKKAMKFKKEEVKQDAQKEGAQPEKQQEVKQEAEKEMAKDEVKQQTTEKSATG